MIAQYLSGIGIAVYALLRCPQVRSIRRLRSLRWARITEILSFSTLTCVQQSVMNLGILTVQGLVNSFGTVVMAAFAAAVKIDAFAYMPVQDFGNAFSTFIAQNYGARETGSNPLRAEKRRVQSPWPSVWSYPPLSVVFARPLMTIFVEAGGDRDHLRRAYSICALKARSTAASAACSCSTACTGRWKSRG